MMVLDLIISGIWVLWMIPCGFSRPHLCTVHMIITSWAFPWCIFTVICSCFLFPMMKWYMEKQRSFRKCLVTMRSNSRRQRHFTLMCTCTRARSWILWEMSLLSSGSGMRPGNRTGICWNIRFMMHSSGFMRSFLIFIWKSRHCMMENIIQTALDGWKWMLRTMWLMHGNGKHPVRRSWRLWTCLISSGKISR